MSSKPSYRVLSQSNVKCPHCQNNVDTVPYPKAGRVAYLWCLGLFVFTGICCLAPFMIDGCMDIEQRCKICEKIVKYERAICCDMAADQETGSVI